MIRIFQILNEPYNDELEGWVAYNTETKRFAMRILEDFKGKHPDIRFMLFHNQCGYVNIPEFHVDRWVAARIVPPNRQNIADILNDCGLSEYDEFGLMLATEGRGQMDKYHIKELSDKSDEYKMVLGKLDWTI